MSNDRTFMRTPGILVRSFIALALSAVLYVMIIELYMVPSVEPLSQKDLLLQQYGLLEKGFIENIQMWINHLAISKLLSQEQGVILGIYIAIYIIFLFHTIVTLNSKYLLPKRVDYIQTFTVFAASTLGTIGTMYAVAVALSAKGTEMVSTNQIIKEAFFDAIYTTIVGLSVTLLCVFINIFNYRKET